MIIHFCHKNIYTSFPISFYFVHVYYYSFNFDIAISFQYMSVVDEDDLEDGNEEKNGGAETP